MVNIRRGDRERGASLIVALIILVLISLSVVSAYNMSWSNTKSVSNVQHRTEAISAANRAVENLVSGDFTTALNSTNNQNIDLDKDGTNEYTVAVAIPACPFKVRRLSQDQPSGYEVGDGTSTVAGVYATDYELTATVGDVNTGASVEVRQGVRVPMDESDYQTRVLPCGLTLGT